MKISGHEGGVEELRAVLANPQRADLEQQNIWIRFMVMVITQAGLDLLLSAASVMMC